MLSIGLNLLLNPNVHVFIVNKNINLYTMAKKQFTQAWDDDSPKTKRLQPIKKNRHRFKGNIDLSRLNDDDI